MGRSVRHHRGGTLLEVLVSLLIITMVASSMLEVTAQKRRALAESQNAEAGVTWAMAWRVARQRDEDWAAGDGGFFPERPDIRWHLEEAFATADAKVTPDHRWQRLVITLESQDPSPKTSFLFRQEDVLATPDQRSGGQR